MVSEPVHTYANKKQERIEGKLEMNPVPSFDEHVAETQQYRASIVRFRGNRFRLSDAETEAMLRVSMEAIQDEW